MIVFLVLTVLAVGIAAFSSKMKQAILSLWVGGFTLGCVYLSLGAELAGIVQWIVSTVLAISFIFFSVMFGEYDGKESDPVSSKLKPFLSLLAGLGFVGLVALSVRELPQAPLNLPADGNDLSSFGKALISNHFLALEIVSITLFVIILGGGVIARPLSEENP